MVNQAIMLAPNGGGSNITSGCCQQAMKVVVLGRGGVGKSALIVRLITKRFITEYAPTLEASYLHSMMIDNEIVNFQILDTAGQETNEGKILWGDAFAIVYSVTDRDSFTAAKEIKSFIDQVKPFRAPCVIIGNKTDLLHQRVVTYEEGAELAGESACMFTELSAADEVESISSAWRGLYNEIVLKRPKRRRSYGSVQLKGMLTRMFTPKQNRMKSL